MFVWTSLYETVPLLWKSLRNCFFYIFSSAFGLSWSLLITARIVTTHQEPHQSVDSPIQHFLERLTSYWKLWKQQHAVKIVEALCGTNRISLEKTPELSVKSENIICDDCVHDIFHKWMLFPLWYPAYVYLRCNTSKGFHSRQKASSPRKMKEELSARATYTCVVKNS